jgi:hypothetical protein
MNYNNKMLITLNIHVALQKKIQDVSFRFLWVNRNNLCRSYYKIIHFVVTNIFQMIVKFVGKIVINL